MSIPCSGGYATHNMSVVIGGTSLSGGTGSVWGTLIGAVLLDRLRQEQV